MGGPLWHPKKADVGEPIETHDFHDTGGVVRKIAVFKNPKTGHYHIADRESGALVGHGKEIGLAIAEVVSDIAQGEPDFMDSQIENAKKEMAQAEEYTAEEFWRGFLG